MFARKLITTAIAASFVFAAGCGGGGGGTPAPDTTLNGVAAAGAPLIGQVTVRDALGATTSAYIEADGSYAIDVSGMTAPFRLRAEGTVGGHTYRLHSYAEAADVNGTVNITPFTDLIIANAAGVLASTFFDSATTSLDAAEIDAQETALQAKLQPILTALGLGTTLDLLNQSFSANHSGLDAVLDVINISYTGDVATIRNIIDSTTITDNVADTQDNSTVLPDPSANLGTAVTDIQAIANIFTSLTTAFASGLPTQAAIQNYFATSFLDDDTGRSQFLTSITSNPDMIGIMFNNVVVQNLDSVAGTAEVVFNVGFNGVIDPHPATWHAVKNGNSWQLNGNQQIVETYFSFHCNDYDGAGSWAGSCGINTRFWDNDETNNGTGGVFIASGTVRILDGTDGVTEKAIVYLGTPAGAAPGDVQVYNESTQGYTDDWKGFGTGVGEINSSIFAVGDIVEYNAYTEALNISNATAPAIAGGAVPVVTYTETLLYAPATLGKYPTATSATQTAINNYTLGNSLIVAWTLASGTVNDEVLVQISDGAETLENRIQTTGHASNSVTVTAGELDTSASLLNQNALTYELRVRIYSKDPLTGQEHSRDYAANIPGPAAGGGGGGGSSLTCSYQSGWDNTLYGGAGGPITPNSFADYEAVVGACGTAQTFAVANIAGGIFMDGANTVTFNDSAGTGTQASPKTGVFHDAGQNVDVSIEWYLETATGGHTYLVVYSNNTVDPNAFASGEWFRETKALTAATGATSGSVLTFVNYAENANYSDSNRATGSDGEIWNGTMTIQ